MGKQVVKRAGSIDPQTFNVGEAISELLPRGHVIHGYSNASNRRLLMVLETREYSDDAPLLGFGVDGQAERALARALLTYAMRDRDELTHITEAHYPESTEAQVYVDANRSRFDNIVWGGDFWLRQVGSEVMAGSQYGGGNGLQPLEVTAADPLAAIIALTEAYDYMTPGPLLLPPISLG